MKTTYALPVSSQLRPPRLPHELPPHLRPARWKIRTKVTEADRAVAAALGLSPITAAVLRVRGLEEHEGILEFLQPTTARLHDPNLLPDCAVAVERLHRAVTTNESILVFGDYDVDGVTSTALLTRALASLGAKVSWRLPERKGEGYGLSVVAIEEAHAANIKLVVSADCGIRDIEAASRARELGIDLIITDHHEPGAELPQALAVVNPKRADSVYPFRELSGCGVAFKVLQALIIKHWPRHAASFWDRFVDLAGMAAIADCVPLIDENRILAREGLKQLGATQKLGLQHLMRVARIDTTRGLRSSHVGFGLGPRLNAAGRLDSATKSLRLLMSLDDVECAALAGELEEHNVVRRELQNRVTDEAVLLASQQTDLHRDRVLVVAGTGWHGGVMGLVAGRLAERYCRPAIVLNIHDGIAHGSGRSAAGFDLHATIEATRDLLLSGGGHEAACGMSLSADNLDEFRERVLRCGQERLQEDDIMPRVEADVEVSGRDLTAKLVDDLARLEPCGQGNAEPLFVLRNAKILDGKSMGRTGEHLKWFLDADGARLEAVWWRPGERAANFISGTRADICFAPELNEWNGQTRLQLVVKAARKAD
ncbi:MAG TPA: single-stranded-DNA-specific exonuclease RecJ [Abditibacteriaceae bacterium]|jgi:single-stranded-DNA-specific exonuclease